MTLRPYILMAALGLACITLLTRACFFWSQTDWRLPVWVERGLHYAPIAALAAVVAPEVFLHDGAILTTWQNARLLAAVAGLAVYYWRRDVLWTIAAGMAVFLPLRLALGW